MEDSALAAVVGLSVRPISTPPRKPRWDRFFFLLPPPPRISTLFPYTTLFRSVRRQRGGQAAQGQRLERRPRRSQHLRQPRNRSEETRLNSSHRTISYAVFCLKKKNEAEKDLALPDLSQLEHTTYYI